MMEFKHTPGPWIVRHNWLDGKGSDFILRAKDMSAYIVFAGPQDQKEDEYNAKLIAKAPQMLMHLVEIIKEIDLWSPISEHDECVIRAKSTLKETLGSTVES